MRISLGIEGPHHLPLSFNLVYNPLYQRVAKDRTAIKNRKESAAAKILMESKKTQEKQSTVPLKILDKCMEHVHYSGLHFYFCRISCYCLQLFQLQKCRINRQTQCYKTAEGGCQDVLLHVGDVRV